MIQTTNLSGRITRLLGRIQSADGDGDSQARRKAQGELLEWAYDELRRMAGGMMRRERAGHTLQPTALVNEAAMRLLGSQSLEKASSRAYFFGAMATAMRRVLVDHARGKGALRRGGDRQRAPYFVADEALDVKQCDLVQLDDALKQLEAANARQGEIVTLRVFGGLTMQEIADQLGVSLSTVEKDWRFAQAWLARQLGA